MGRAKRAARRAGMNGIVDMLGDEAPEKRIAAAIVLGELEHKGPEVTLGLVAMLETGGPAMQRHALDALARIGVGRALPKVLPLLASRDDDVRAAAVEAVTSVGGSVVPAGMARLAEAQPAERRALDAILGQLGGKEAFTTLLESLDTDDEEAARARTLEIRAQIREASREERRSFHAQIGKFLGKLGKQKGGSSVGLAAGVKVLGYLEDPKTLDALLGYAKGKKVPAEVKKEALIALRFAMTDPSIASKAVGALVDAAEADDRALAQTALMTLAGMDLSPKLAARFTSLVFHPDVERAQVVIHKLAGQEGAEPAEVLVDVLAKGDDRRADMAAKAIEGKKEAIAPLADALAKATNDDRAHLIRKVLRPHAADLTSAQKRKLLDKVAAGTPGWHAALDVAYAADARSTAKALRDLAAQAKKTRKIDLAIGILRELVRGAEATDDDRYLLASLELAKSRLDTRPAARSGDPALRLLWDLKRRGYDVQRALRQDRAVDLDQLYYIGFHFIEEGHPLGEDLLTEVAEKAGRKKLGKAAKNKLALAARE